MPVINVELGAGQTDEGQKRELISRLTAAAVEITKIPAEKYIVFINELPFENIGLGGRTVKDIRAGQ